MRLVSDPSPLVSALTSPVATAPEPLAGPLARRFYRVHVYEIDSNGNGLPDWWERKFFQSSNPFACPGAPSYLDTDELSHPSAWLVLVRREALEAL